MKTATALIFFLFFIVVILSSGCSPAERMDNGHEGISERLEEQEEKVHIHAYFKVYINSNKIDFSVPMYQLKDKSVHVEDGIGELVHVHKEGITIGDFLNTLDIGFDKKCIVISGEDSYCSEDDKKIRFYVNGIENDEFEDYEIRNLDKILVSYGGGDIEKQLESVTNLAAEQ